MARGRLVGPTTLGGVPVEHYVIDGDAFLAAAQRSSDPKLKAFGDALWSADDADLYVDAEGGYPVAFRGSFSGTYEPLKFEDFRGEETDLERAQQSIDAARQDDPTHSTKENANGSN